jgi:hypothetical protein
MSSAGAEAWAAAMHRRRQLQQLRERLEAAHGRRCRGPTNGTRPCGARLGALNRSGYCVACSSREKSRAAALRRAALLGRRGAA